MNAFYFVCEFVWVAAEIWMTFELLNSLAEPRRERRTELMIRAIAVLVVAGFDIVNRLNVMTLFSNLFLVLISVIVGLVGCFLYQIRIDCSLTVSYLFFIIVAYLDFFIQALLYIVIVEVIGKEDRFLQVSIERGIYLLFYSVLVIWLGLMLSREFPVLYKEIKHKALVGVCSVAGGFVLMAYLQRVYLFEVSIEYMGVWEITILSSIFCVVLVTFYFARKRNEQKDRLLQVKMDTLWNGYQHIMELYQEKSTLLHDEKNHILFVRCLVEQGELQRAVEYMDDISAKLQRQVIRQITEHHFLDMVLSMKAEQAEQEGISVEFRFDCLSDLKLRDFDICALFANLLDNAIEANRALSLEHKRWLRLTGRRHGHMLSIKLENPVGEIDEWEPEKRLRTNKDSRYHGFGLQSMQKVVDSYEGYMEYSVAEGVFLQEIFLYCLEDINETDEEEKEHEQKRMERKIAAGKECGG